jgi:hypothetical protein
MEIQEVTLFGETTLVRHTQCSNVKSGSQYYKREEFVLVGCHKPDKYGLLTNQRSVGTRTGVDIHALTCKL